MALAAGMDGALPAPPSPGSGQLAPAAPQPDGDAGASFVEGLLQLPPERAAGLVFGYLQRGGKVAGLGADEALPLLTAIGDVGDVVPILEAAASRIPLAATVLAVCKKNPGWVGAVLAELRKLDDAAAAAEEGAEHA
jgi:hypothetical protein